MARQVAARMVYREKMGEAERRVERARGGRLEGSVAEVLEGRASRVWGLVNWLGVVCGEGVEEEIVREMVRVGLGLGGREAEEWLRDSEEGWRVEFGN